MIVYIVLFILILLVIDIYMSILRNRNRIRVFKEAKEQSKKTNKPLLVIGNPNSGFWNKNIMKGYGCGDLCTDLIGCDNCPKSIKGDLLDVLNILKTNKYVIFESCVLEYIDKNRTNEIKKQIQRVSGNDYYQVRLGRYIFPLKQPISQFGINFHN